MQCHNRCEHQVQFYKDETFLVDQIWAHLHDEASKGSPSIVIATRAHLAKLQEKATRSRMAGGERSPLRSSFVELDADETLSRILVDGWPDEERFSTCIGGLLHRVTDGGRHHVRAYGEMVALLCADGRHQAAIRLEHLWNELGLTYSFSLLCGYPMTAFTREEGHSVLGDLCRLHSEVRTPESGCASDSLNDEKRRIMLLQHEANALQAEDDNNDTMRKKTDADTAPPGTSTSTISRTILIVDDNVDAAESLSEILKAFGHRVHTSHDGAEAIETAPAIGPDVVILDIGLPSMSGYQVAQRLRTELALQNTLLIALSGYTLDQDRTFAMDAGFDHHLAKPVDLPRLMELLAAPDAAHASSTCVIG